LLLVAASTAAAAALAPAVALAQDVQDGEFSVQRFEPAMGPRNFLSVEGGRTDGDLSWSVGFMFDYQNSPFRLKSCISQTDCNEANAIVEYDLDVVEHMFTFNFWGTFTPIPNIQIGLRMPMAYAMGDGFDATGSLPDAGISAFGLGDPTLEGKFRILGEREDMFVLAAAADVSAPLGNATAAGSYIGNDSPVTVGGRAIVDGKFGPVLAAVNLRGIWRQDGTVGSATIGPEFRYGAALGYEIDEIFTVMAETFGATRFETRNGTNSLEIDAGLKLKPGDMGLELTVGGGTGLVQGVGVPLGRAMVGIGFVSEPEPVHEAGPTPGQGEEDSDKDGVPDWKDKCPSVPGTKEKEGCPASQVDSDNDGVPDSADKCPSEPGTIRTPEFMGCPDTDGDGVADKADKCPNEKEDTDGFQDTDGCPDLDNDGDGVPDQQDECDGEPETMNGFKDTDGCADEAPDQDGDGIADTLDKCPAQAEVLNGNQDDDGCPDIGLPLATVKTDSISLTQKLQFNGGELAAASRTALDALAAGLKNHKEIFLVRVTAVMPEAEGELAPKRSVAVVSYLFDKGVEARRLEAKAEIGPAPDVRFEVVWSTKKPKPAAK
jgi:hypothetical protein